MVCASSRTRAHRIRCPHPAEYLRIRRSTEVLFGQRRWCTELIAACNSTGVTPATGDFSFNNALTAELQRLAIIGRTFSAAELHEGMLARIQRKSNAQQELSSTPPTHQAAPVIIRLNGGHQYPSLALRAFRSKSDDNAAEAHRYQDRLWKRVVDRWETSIPAKIRTAIQARKEAELVETHTQNLMAKVHLQETAWFFQRRATD